MAKSEEYVYQDECEKLFKTCLKFDDNTKVNECRLNAFHEFYDISSELVRMFDNQTNKDRCTPIKISTIECSSRDKILRTALVLARNKDLEDGNMDYPTVMNIIETFPNLPSIQHDIEFVFGSKWYNYLVDVKSKPPNATSCRSLSPSPITTTGQMVRVGARGGKKQKGGKTK